MKHFPQAFSLLVILLISTDCQSPADRPLITPMIDGQIEEYIELGVQPIDLGDNVHLYVYQNEYYVWLAYAYPEGSYGILDMEIVSPKVQDTLNLHVSAQLGDGSSKKAPPGPKILKAIFGGITTDGTATKYGRTVRTKQVNGLDQNSKMPWPGKFN